MDFPPFDGRYSWLGVTLFCIHGGVLLLGLLLFAVRSEHEPVKSRNRVLVILQTLCGIGYFATIVFALPFGGAACEVGFFLFPLGIPLLAMVRAHLLALSRFKVCLVVKD